MTQFISIKDLSNEQKISEICQGINVEYSDPAGDTDTGNFAEVVRIDAETRYKMFTEEEFTVTLVELVLNQGQKVTIKASQLLAVEDIFAA